MKIKHLTLVALIALGAVACNNAEEVTEESTPVVEETVTEEIEVTNYNINIEKSLTNWKGDMAGMYSHTGTINFTTGVLTLTNGNVTSGNFTIDMNSMVTTDDIINYGGDEEKRAKLIGHLGADDFFNTAEFPTATFEITGNNDGLVTGNLTIRGISHEETLTDVVVTENETGAEGTASLTFDRQKYDVKFSHPAEDMVLSDDITLTINIVATK